MWAVGTARTCTVPRWGSSLKLTNGPCIHLRTVTALLRSMGACLEYGGLLEHVIFLPLRYGTWEG